MTAAPLADVIYAYGKAVDEGRIAEAEAIDYLTANIGLTRLGAEDVLRSWRTIHARYGSTS